MRAVCMSPDFFFSMEEFDMSYKALKQGFKIKYVPDIHVIHKKDTRGRSSSEFLLKMTLLNKMKIAYLHLPNFTMLANIFL